MKHVFVRMLGVVCAFSLSTTALKAQTEVENYIPGSTVEGVTYFLPKTAFRVVLTAEKSVTTPGEFYKYAFKYMRLQDVPISKSVKWRIKNIELLPYGVPDKSKAVSIKLKGRTIAPLVGLSNDGLLLSINADVEEETLPPLPESVPAPVPVNPRKFMNQEMLQAGSVSKMAELIAQEIYDLRESRKDLITGQADNTPKDGQQLQLMINSLDEENEALESMFKGTEATSTEVFSFDFTPNQQTDRLVLLRFSEKLGPLAADDYAGEPVYVSIKCQDNMPAAVSDEKADAKKAKMTMGIKYNVPVKTDISIFTSDKKYVEKTVPVAQFGKTEILSNVLFDKNATTQVTFFQSTGAIKDVVK